MYHVILSPAEHHNVRDVQAYRLAHARLIARKRRNGQRVAVHLVEAPKVARIDAGSWLIDCECGAGNATAPDWGVAFCFGCGAEHTTIVFPEPTERQAIEAALIERPTMGTRFWFPEKGDTAATLRAENAARLKDEK